jgi:hypothetical protein
VDASIPLFCKRDGGLRCWSTVNQGEFARHALRLFTGPSTVVHGKDGCSTGRAMQTVVRSRRLHGAWTNIGGKNRKNIRKYAVVAVLTAAGFALTAWGLSALSSQIASQFACGLAM